MSERFCDIIWNFLKFQDVCKRANTGLLLTNVNEAISELNMLKADVAAAVTFLPSGSTLPSDSLIIDFLDIVAGVAPVLLGVPLPLFHAGVGVYFRCSQRVIFFCP